MVSRSCRKWRRASPTTWTRRVTRRSKTSAAARSPRSPTGSTSTSTMSPRPRSIRISASSAAAVTSSARTPRIRRSSPISMASAASSSTTPNASAAISACSFARSKAALSSCTRQMASIRAPGFATTARPQTGRPIRTTRASQTRLNRAPGLGPSAPSWSWSLVATRLFELAEHRVDVDPLLGRLRLRHAEHFELARRRGFRRGDLGRNQRLGPVFLDLRTALGGPVDLEVEIDLRAEAERHRVQRLKIGRVPVGPVADRLQRVLGRPDEAHDLRVLELWVIAQQPQHRIGPVLPPRQRRVARPARLLEFGCPHLGRRQMEAVIEILLCGGDLLARQLAGRDRVVALDAGRNFAVGDALDLEWVQFAELSDLVEGQGRVLDQPYGGRLRHQRRVGHLGGSLQSFGRAAPGSARRRRILKEQNSRGMSLYRRHEAELQSPQRNRRR